MKIEQYPDRKMVMSMTMSFLTGLSDDEEIVAYFDVNRM